MQLTSPIEPVFVTDSIVEEPGRRRRNRHEPRLCATCEAPLAGQSADCWRCGATAVEPVRRTVTQYVAAAPGPRVPNAPAPPATDDTPTPLWTRHTLGAIEADRDRRHARSAQTTVRYRTAPSAPAIPLRRELLAR